MTTNQELIQKAISVINRKEFEDSSMGGVGSALVTEEGNIYTGVCIDMSSSMGFCAEHNAIGSMITAGEYKIDKIVAVWKDVKGDAYILSPCGRCREFMYRTNEENLHTEVIMEEDKVIELKELLPCYDWCEKI